MENDPSRVVLGYEPRFTVEEWKQLLDGIGSGIKQRRISSRVLQESIHGDMREKVTNAAVDQLLSNLNSTTRIDDPSQVRFATYDQIIYPVLCNQRWVAFLLEKETDMYKLAVLDPVIDRDDSQYERILSDLRDTGLIASEQYPLIPATEKLVNSAPPPPLKTASLQWRHGP